MRKLLVLFALIGLVLQASASEIELTISSDETIHPQDTGHIHVKVKNNGEGKELYLRVFSSALDIENRERRIRLGTGEDTILIFSYAVKDMKAGFYEISVVYTFENTTTGTFPDETTMTYSQKISRIEKFVQRYERPTTIRLLQDRIRLESGQNTKFTFVSDGDVRFVKYTIDYDKNLMDIAYDGSLQNFSGEKEEEIKIMPKAKGEYKAEIDIFFVDALGELHNDTIPITIISGSNTFPQSVILLFLLTAILLFAGRFALTNGKTKHKI